MMILRGEPVPGEAGSNPPASGAPEPRLWGAARRIDKAELRVQSVCVFCNSFKGSDIAGLDRRQGNSRRYSTLATRNGRGISDGKGLISGAVRRSAASPSLCSISTTTFAWNFAGS